MEIIAEKTKLMTNNTSGVNTEIKVNGQKLETVTSFKYLGSVITDEGSEPEILSRIAQATAALTRLKTVWIDESISQTPFAKQTTTTTTTTKKPKRLRVRPGLQAMYSRPVHIHSQIRGDVYSQDIWY